MMEQPFVTVIIPTFNRRKLLAGAVEALFHQTYPVDRFELIVVDNGSTDGTAEWAAALSPPFRFRFLLNETPFRVPGQSRNIGLAHAEGEIVAYTDSDCVPCPEWLAEGVAALMADLKIGLAQGMTVPADEEKPVVYRTISVLSHKAYFETCNIFYRTEALRKVGGIHRDFIERYPPPYFGEDTDLGYRVLEAGYRQVFVPAAQVNHRIHKHKLKNWIREPLVSLSWPFLVRKHPRIRRDLLFLGLFIAPMTAWFDLGLLGLVLAIVVHPLFLLLFLPFLVAKFRESGEHLSLPLRFVRLIGATLRAILIFGVLLYGSVRFLCPVF
jgi:glycosyltransferase involved in cell wall biosynthesis